MRKGGIKGLKMLSGRGRKPILDEADLEKVKEVVAEHRQKLSVAREELEQALGKTFSQDTLKRFVKKNTGRYKRVRKRPLKEPCPHLYALKVEALALLERLSDWQLIDLYYADECRVSLSPVVPYAWQFAAEEVWTPSSQGPGLNCFGLIARDNTLHFETITNSIDSSFIIEQS